MQVNKGFAARTKVLSAPKKVRDFMSKGDKT